MIKVTVKPEQIAEHNLPPNNLAKEAGSRHAGFERVNGKFVYELEALPPNWLGHYLESAILATIDRDTYEAELDKEVEESAILEHARIASIEATRRVIDAFPA